MLYLLAQQVSISLGTAIQVVSILGALGAIFYRIGRFETKHEMAATHLKESVETFKAQMKEVIDTEIARLSESINRVDGNSQKVVTWDTRFGVLEERVKSQGLQVDRNSADIEKLKQKPSGTMSSVTVPK